MSSASTPEVFLASLKVIQPLECGRVSCAECVCVQRNIKDATNVLSNPSLDNMNLFPQHVE